MRDTRKTYDYFQEEFEDQTEDIKETIEFIDSGKSNNKNMQLLSIFNSKARQLVIAYSMGKDKEELTILYIEFLDLLKKYNPYIYHDSLDANTPTIYKNYLYLLWMLCLGYLLEIPTEKMTLFKDKVVASDRNDLLTSTILKQLFNDVEIVEAVLMKKPIPLLKPIL